MRHVQKNKISDKLTRRGIRYFDLMHFHSPQEEYQQYLAEGEFKGLLEKLYGDLAEHDFNDLYSPDKEQKFAIQHGKTIAVTLNLERNFDGEGNCTGMNLTRLVKDEAFRKLEDNKFRPAKSSYYGDFEDVFEIGK